MVSMDNMGIKSGNGVIYYFSDLPNMSGALVN
jgi:hypothetical protein